MTAILAITLLSALAPADDLYDHSNLMAWCIVPFDSAKRGPEQRAEMLDQLGIHRFAYDWRAEHLPTFDAELDALAKHHIELTAVWFPTTLDADAHFLLDRLKARGLTPQLWVMGGGEPTHSPEEQAERVKAEAARIRPIAEAAAAQGSKVALYNHGGWFGEPENQIAIIKELGLPNVGIVYNLHHGHEHLGRFPALLEAMKPHLLAININGMVADGETSGRKILVLGQGDRELGLLRLIRDSGWRGPVGILNHTDEDAEARLRANLNGLDALRKQLDTPGPLPLGFDAFRLWHRWPDQRIGQRTVMRSTYDRQGGNETADASHFLYQEADDRNVTLDLAGPGVLAFVRTNHWHGSPWHYEVDGTDHVVSETATDDPVNALARLKSTVFRPEGLFPEPLAWTWSTTKGADLSWIPIPFEHSLRLAYSRTHYGTGYDIIHRLDPSAPTVSPLRSWDGQTPPPADVLELINRACDNPLTVDPTPSGLESIERHDASSADAVRPLELKPGPRSLRLLALSLPESQALAFGQARLQITFDGRAAPSVDAPIALFFGAGRLYWRDPAASWLVRGFPMSIRRQDGRVLLACRYPMPYFRSATVRLVGAEAIDDLTWTVSTAPLESSPSDVGYFHATYRDMPHPAEGRDLVLLDTADPVEGSREWSGQFVGMSWIFSHAANLTTLEGDPRFFFDDARTPQAQGTGTEEWGGGGDYWGGRTMTLPFAGHPVGAPEADQARDDIDRVESAYRFLLSDAMPFGRRAVIGLEHGGDNRSTEHYESVVYWYGAPAASLVTTDTLDVGKPEDEQAHAYTSHDGSEVVSVTSRYELGPDTIDGREVYPPETEDGRTVRTRSEFNLTLRPDNLGVVLRRTLDYAIPNQRAEVSVAAVDAQGATSAFEPAGTWLLAGSSTCVFSNPKGELNPAQHIVQTSNRRLRDDEFILPRALTQGRSKIRIRIDVCPDNRPLFPGHPFPEPSAWSELRYTADCWVRPHWSL
jgi:sugar phosphate isomerase/epimerase